MWFLPTRGRPGECIQMISAMRAVGDVPKVAVMVDDEPKHYAGVPWPKHWDIHFAPEHLEMTRALNTLLAMYPGEKTYGFFGDHFRVLTKWSAQLEEAAGDWFMAWPNDGKISHRQPAGAPTFGSKLVRALGWICLPATHHLCTDRVWWLLWKELGIAKHVEAVRYTRDWDRKEVGRVYNGVNMNVHDYHAWLAWEELESKTVMHRLRKAMFDDGVPFDGTRAVGGSSFVAGW